MSDEPKLYNPEDTQMVRDLRAEVERLLMSRARKDAMLAVYMQAIAARSRSGEQEWAQDIVRRADEAALRVKRSDLTVATVSADADELARRVRLEQEKWGCWDWLRVWEDGDE